MSTCSTQKFSLNSVQQHKLTSFEHKVLPWLANKGTNYTCTPPHSLTDNFSEPTHVAGKRSQRRMNAAACSRTPGLHDFSSRGQCSTAVQYRYEEMCAKTWPDRWIMQRLNDWSIICYFTTPISTAD